MCYMVSARSKQIWMAEKNPTGSLSLELPRTFLDGTPNIQRNSIQSYGRYIMLVLVLRAYVPWDMCAQQWSWGRWVPRTEWSIPGRRGSARARGGFCAGQSWPRSAGSWRSLARCWSWSGRQESRWLAENAGRSREREKGKSKNGTESIGIGSFKRFVLKMRLLNNMFFF